MKTIAPKLKFLKYLFWLAPMLLVAGLTAGAVSGIWVGIPLALVIGGIVVFGLWLLWLNQFGGDSSEGFWGQRSTQAGTNALIGTIAMLAILAILNFLAVRYGGRTDLTENQQFTLAPETRQVVQTLKQPIRVVIFEAQQNPQDRELLESYRRQGTQLSYEFVNPTQQPTLAQEFQVKNVGDVFVQAGQRRRFVQTVTGPENPAQERLSEIKLTNAIDTVTSDQQSQVYFLQGHGERPLEEGRGAVSTALKALGDKNFTVKPLNLVDSPDLPTDAQAIAIVGPKKALLEAEARALDAYLKRGGSLLLLLEPGIDAGLNTLLTSWGVTLENQLVLDRSGAKLGLGPADVPVTRYGNHPITKDFTNSTLSFFSFARPVDVKTLPDVSSTPLLYSGDRSWAKTDINSKALEFDPQRDRPGPLVLGVAFSRPISPAALTQPPTPAPSPSAPASPTASPVPPTVLSPGSQAKESRLVVIGNANFATDGLFNQVINGDVFLNSMRWLSQDDGRSLSIRPKEAKNRRINLTSAQANLASWTALAVLPLLGFGTALIVWWRRR
ncbi:MAG TPA: Gldg family protein [Thermosynechococcaceae cyanobacterium]